MRLPFQEMRQIDQAKQRGSYQGKRGEQTEIPSPVGTGKEEAEKGADGSKTAYGKRIGDFSD